MLGLPRSALGSLVLAGRRLSTAAHARRPACGFAKGASVVRGGRRADRSAALSLAGHGQRVVRRTAKLSIAAANMRGKGKDPDVADLMPSIRARGVLVPLLVRPNCADGHYEIVAGRRRFTAVGAVAREGGAVRPLPCAILDEDDDADALEASMLENLARVQPDEVSQWEAFVALVKAGRSVEEVADSFGFEPGAVKRILALGNLLPRIRTLYRGGEIDAGTVRHLTLASKSQQKSWLALFDDEGAYCPTGHQLKAWLFGGTAIAVIRHEFEASAEVAEANERDANEHPPLAA